MCFVGLRLGGRVFKQKTVGHVLSTFGGEILLAQKGSPPEGAKHPPYEVIFGLRFVRGLIGGKMLEDIRELTTQLFDECVANSRPIR
jgi:hypothetical protein